jgi:hypothetical protein
MVYLQRGGRQKSRAPAEVAHQCIPSYTDCYQFVRYPHTIDSHPAKHGNEARQSQVRTQKAVDENLAISRRTEQTLSELCEHVKAITSGQPPKVLGYSWQGSSGPKHGVINLEDASGRFVELPAMLCRDFDVNAHSISE